VSKGADPGDDMPQRLLPPGENRLRRVLVVVSALVAVTAALALVWTHSPLKDFVTRENAVALASAFAGFWWAPIAVFLAYTPASFIMFPRWIITMTAVIAFGPLEGFVLAMSGVILAGIVTYVPGRFVDPETVRPMVEGPLKPAARFMERKGLAAVTLIRLVPIAPFPVVNLLMGALRVKLWHFVCGTFLGMLPGMIAATVLSDQLAAALEDPAGVNFWIIAAAVVGFATIVYFGQRYVRRHSAHEPWRRVPTRGATFETNERQRTLKDESKGATP
jgi:phospholipase D1/2